jgi:hypothetical protein
MFFVGLVGERRWEPPEDVPKPSPEPSRHVPWRELACLAGVFALLFLSPVAGHALGGFAGYVVLLLAVALGIWRVDRWCSRQYWCGLRDYQA